MSTKSGSKSRGFGTPLYASPQQLLRVDYTQKTDIWALGILTFNMLMRTTPFDSSQLNELLRKIEDGAYLLLL